MTEERVNFTSPTISGFNQPGLLCREANKSPKAITVSIVDDEDNERRLMKRILDGSSDLRWLASDGNGLEALAGIVATNPMVVLMDIQMPGMSGFECTRRLKAIRPEIVVVMVTGLADSDSVLAAVEAGGDGYLVKPFALGQCLATITCSVRRARWRLEPPKSSAEEEAARVTQGAAAWDRLTVRERKIMEMIECGLRNKEIADRLSVSVFTVQKVVHRIFEKLHVDNRIEAMAKCFDWRQGAQVRVRSG
jgi:DNA-binding NarL/FixJ family response regulator